MRRSERIVSPAMLDLRDKSVWGHRHVIKLFISDMISTAGMELGAVIE